MDDESNKTISFAEFTLDTVHRRLLRNGNRVALHAKAFDLLTFLVRNNGRVVSKNEILDEVWDGQFVEEANLVVQISHLRKALGEIKDSPRFLVTVPGKGYKFTAANGEGHILIETHSFSELTIEHEDVIPQKLTLAKRSALKWKWAGITAVAVLAGVAIGGSLWWRYGADQIEPSPWQNATATQLTDFGGVEAYPSLSPDGKVLLYCRRVNGKYNIFYQRVGGSNPQNLTNDPTVEDWQPAFSPDGEQIAFRSSRSGGGIFVMGATGESIRRLTDFGYNPSWSPDGKELVVGTDRFSEPQTRSVIPSPLWVITVETGGKRQLYGGDGVQPSWSPNGRRIAFWALQPGSGRRDIWTITTNGDEPVQVTNDEALDWNPVWSPDEKFLYFASNRGGSMNFWRVPVDPFSGKLLGEAEPVTTPSTYSQHLGFSQNGKQMVYVQKSESVNLFRRDWHAAEAKAGSDEKAITQGGRFISSPDLSPDGGWFVYTSQGEKQEDLFLVDKDGATRQLTNDSFNDREPRWSPDGRRVAFYSDRSGRFEVWVINMDGSDLRQVTYTSGQPVVFPIWSPDGDRILFKQRDEMPFIVEVNKNWHEQTPSQLPKPAQMTATMNFWVSSWSPDGSKLVGVWTDRANGSRTLTLFDFPTQQYIELSNSGEIRESLGAMRFVDDRRLLYKQQNAVYLLDSETKKSKEIFRSETDAIDSYCIAPDNGAFYYTMSKIEANVWQLAIE